MSESKKTIELVVDRLTPFKPKSVFLYGSRARGDFTENSDYEIGVLLPEESIVSRTEIGLAVEIEKVSVYPFVYEDFVAGQIDTPFQKSLYARELALSAKTITGEEVVEQLKPPPITTLDLLQEISFDKGVAIAAVRTLQSGDRAAASTGFFKSCFFAVRALEILESKKFPIKYDDILAFSKKVLPAEYRDVMGAAWNTRQSGEFSDDMIFQNIALINQHIEPKAIEKHREQGGSVVLA